MQPIGNRRIILKTSFVGGVGYGKAASTKAECRGTLPNVQSHVPCKVPQAPILVLVRHQALQWRPNRSLARGVAVLP